MGEYDGYNVGWNGTSSMDVTSATEIITTISKMVETVASPQRHVSIASQMVLTLVYMSGVIGNISALVILFLRDKVSENVANILRIKMYKTFIYIYSRLTQTYCTGAFVF